jgi:hypothetical protein
MIDGVWCSFATETQKSRFLGDFPTTLVLLGCGKPGLTTRYRKGIVERGESMVFSLTFDTELQTWIYVSSKITQE